jgi:hypothetical protein
MIGEMRNGYKLLMRKPEEKRPLERPRCRWVDARKMNLRERGWGGLVWIDLAQDSGCRRADVNTVMSHPIL